MQPALLTYPYNQLVTNILAKFENGKPLSTEELHFLWRHEKTLNHHALDLVIKYYLRGHHNRPDKSISFTIDPKKLDKLTVHELRDIVENLLKQHLSHVDLNMSVDQFLQFKSVGFHELLFWHGPQFLSRSLFSYQNAIPQVLYFQWGKLFGVVKLNSLVDHYVLDGNVLIYFEDMSQRSLNQCVLDYIKTNHMDLTLKLEKTLDQAIQVVPDQEHFFSPTLKPQMYEIPSRED